MAGRGDSFQLQGLVGGRVLNSTDGLVTGPFRWVQIVSDSVLTTFTGNLANASRLVGPTLFAGTGFGCEITGIQVSSGLVIVYSY